MNRFLSLFATTTAALIGTTGQAVPAPVQVKEIVLVHGAVVDGFGWRAAFTAKLPVAAWRDKPSYRIVASKDKTIDPNLERFMCERSGASITDIKASHLVYISQPEAVAAVVRRAARNVK